MRLVHHYFIASFPPIYLFTFSVFGLITNTVLSTELEMLAVFATNSLIAQIALDVFDICLLFTPLLFHPLSALCYSPFRAVVSFSSYSSFFVWLPFFFQISAPLKYSLPRSLRSNTPLYAVRVISIFHMKNGFGKPRLA